jgi:hypothetical protein
LLDPTVAAGFDPDLCDPLNFVLAPCREGAPCAAGVHPIPPGVADEIARTDGLDEPGGEAENAFTELVKLAIEVIREKFNSPRGTL